MVASPRKILIIQLKRAGDVVLTTPVPEVLKRMYPQARIDFLVDAAFAPLLEGNPTVDRVISYDRSAAFRAILNVRRRRYDWVLDFQSSPRSAPIALASGAALTAGFDVPFWGAFYRRTSPRPGRGVTVVAGKLSLLEPWIGSVGEVPERRVYVSADERALARRILPDSRRRGWIGVISPHRHSSRRWLGKHFAALARFLYSADFDVTMFGGPGEMAYVRQVQALAPEARAIEVTSFRQWGALLERCRLVVSGDNGPMHIAVAVACPTVTIYGPTEAACLKPEGPFHRAMQAEDVPCLGCNMNRCPFGHECMTHVSPEQVYKVCEELIHETERQGTPVARDG